MVDENNGPAKRAYRIRNSLASVYFDETAKGRIIFLPEGAILRVIGPSSCLRGGFEVLFERRTYNIFQIDLETQSTMISEPIRVTGRAVATCV
jgi:hypothetical protein